jgi:RNA polymerase sigma factor (sigma-70 family)
VLQEVALAVFSRSRTSADPSNAAAWLYRIAVKQTLLYRRKQGRRHRLVNGYAERVGEPCDSPDDRNPLGWLLLDERRRVVRDALARLPRRDAEMLLLKYSEDWSSRDMAARLGLSEAAIVARLHRARRRLREVLTKSSAIEVNQ